MILGPDEVKYADEHEGDAERIKPEREYMVNQIEEPMFQCAEEDLTAHEGRSESFEAPFVRVVIWRLF